MSNAGQAILTVAGTIVGAYFGYPQLGFVIGSYAGQALFPTQLPTIRAPRLSDIGTTRATVGSPILKGWGCFPSDGCIIAACDVREELVTQSQGKGGPSQKIEQSNYFQSFAIGLNDGLIAGIRRIWANGKLIYDRTPRRDGETADAFQARMAANAALEQIMTVYLGTEDQLPDPTLEAFFGIGNVSAFRGLAYVVFTDWACKDEDGKRMPSQWRFECFTAASIDTGEAVDWANHRFYPWLPGGDPMNPLNDHEFAISGTGFGDAPTKAIPISSIAQGLAVLETHRGKPLGQFQGVAATIATLGGIELGITDTMGGSTAAETDLQLVHFHYNSFASALAPYDVGVSPWAPVGSGHCARMGSYAPFGQTFLSTDGYTLDTLFTDTGNKMYMLVPPGSGQPQYWDFLSFECTFGRLESVGAMIGVKRVPRPPDDPCRPRGLPPPPRVPGTEDFAFVGGKVVRCGGWEKVTTDLYHALRAFSGGPPWNYPLDPVRPVGHPDDNEAFWTQAYAAAVARGDMPPGRLYGVHYPQGQGFAYRRVIQTQTVDVAPVSIEPIAEWVHQACKYQPQQYDVSDLASIEVIGFVVPAPNIGRGVMEALRAIGFFDLTDGAGVMRWVRRGKPITRTLDAREMGAHMVGEDRPTAINSRRAMISGIPRRLRFHYIAYERDFDPGQKDSPIRANVRTAQELDIETTAILDDAHAARIMQSLWADLWAARWHHETSVDTRALADEAADVLGVPVDGQVQRMRIESIDDSMPLTRKYALVRDDDGSWVSYAVATAVPSTPPQLTVPAPAEGFLLDVPMLRDVDNDAGFYFAARSLYGGNVFRGATLVRSTDSGGTYAAAAAASTSPANGVLTAALGASPPGIWDEANAVVVELYNGELESKTATEVLGGSNFALVGRHGSWEIIAFRSATSLFEKTWKLTSLLRGRRGTEHAIGHSVVGDRFILLTGGGINRVPLDLVAVGRSLLYKTVAVAQSVESSTATPFASAGVGLKPFAPASVRGSKDGGSGDWTFQWCRRSRIGNSIVAGASIPLSEETEDYEVDILDDQGDVIDTLSTSTPSVKWSTGDQVTALGASVDAITIDVVQISAAVGRGYATRATLAA